MSEFEKHIGKLIKSWTGKFDVAENPNKNQVYFDNQNGVLTVERKYN